MFTERISSRIIEADKSIIQTMKFMDDARIKSLLVYDGDSFLGMITNGDLQRAIIANKTFDMPIKEILDHTNKKYAHKEDDIKHIKEWMIEVRAELMPILDHNDDLEDVIFWEDLFIDDKKDYQEKINLPVVIMAGGKGTRLKPITNVIPKPLVPIGDKTILETIMDQFEDIGCHHFYMSVNYKADMMKYYLNQLEHKYDIEFFQEDKPLGTIGSVSLLKNKIATPFFVSNCDIIIDQDYREVYDYHIKNENDLTIVTAVKSMTIPYGVVETGNNGIMTGLKEKPVETYMINTGVYILNPELIGLIPQGEFYHITHLMEKIKSEGGRIGCFPVSEHSWHDMGEWNEYLKIINAQNK
jgi:dTDP-glucose pyrophosphorylase